MKRRVGGEHLDVRIRDISRVLEAEQILSAVAHGSLRVHAADGEISAPVPHGVEALSQVLRSLESAGIDIVDIGLRRPTLDDVFMELTGHEATVVEETK